VWISRKTNNKINELDEIFHFTEHKEPTETRENTYIMLQISREPRQIVSFDVAFDKNAARLQGLVDRAPQAQFYATDGNLSYLDVDFYGGKHIRNVLDKRDTHNVESVNADIRHYIKMFSRRNRCFPRSLVTQIAVLRLFIDAYNKFGEYKLLHRVPVVHKPTTDTRHLHKFRQPPFGLCHFV